MLIIHYDACRELNYIAKDCSEGMLVQRIFTSSSLESLSNLVEAVDTLLSESTSQTQKTIDCVRDIGSNVLKYNELSQAAKDAIVRILNL